MGVQHVMDATFTGNHRPRWHSTTLANIDPINATSNCNMHEHDTLSQRCDQNFVQGWLLAGIWNRTVRMLQYCGMHYLYTLWNAPHCEAIRVIRPLTMGDSINYITYASNWELADLQPNSLADSGTPSSCNSAPNKTGLGNLRRPHHR